MNLWFANRNLMIPLLLLPLASCASTDPYPEEWSPNVVVGKGDCPDLTGAFSNTYSTSSEVAPSIEGGLIALLLDSESSASPLSPFAVLQVSIEQPTPERLVIKGWNESKLIRQGERRLSPTSCSEKGVSISGSFKGMNVENMMGTISARTYLNRAENGDLVLRMRSTFTGIALLVPMRVSATNWYQFRQIKKDQSSANTRD